MAEQTPHTSNMAPARDAVPRQRLYRSRNGRLGGVCAGLAKRYATDPDMVRLITVLLAVLTLGAVGVAYLVLWLVLPVEEGPEREVDGRATALSSETYGAVAGAPQASPDASSGSPGLGVAIALVAGIVVLVVAMATSLSSIARSFAPVQFWPLILVAIGIARMVLPDANGRHGLTTALGMALFFAGAIMLLGTLGLAQMNLQAWLSEGAPLLLLAAGFLCMGHGLDSSILTICGVAALVLFCFVGVAFYLEPGSVQRFIALLPNGRTVSIVVVQ